jgi:hypothetical protein
MSGTTITTTGRLIYGENTGVRAAVLVVRGGGQGKVDARSVAFRARLSAFVFAFLALFERERGWSRGASGGADIDATKGLFDDWPATCTMAPESKRMGRDHSPYLGGMCSMPWLPTGPTMSVCRGSRARAYAWPSSPSEVPWAPSEEKKLQPACSRSCWEAIQVL